MVMGQGHWSVCARSAVVVERVVSVGRVGIAEYLPSTKTKQRTYP